MRRQACTVGRKKVKQSRFGLCVLLLAALLLFSLVQLEQKIRPVARLMAEYECREQAVRWMQAAVGDCLQQSPELLKNLYMLRCDENGRVQGAETDTARLARLQYTLEGDLTQAMEAGAADFTIPLGTLLGLQVFSGRGPNVTVKVIPLSHVESRVETDFSAAGVNQTKLQTDLVFSVQLCAVLAGIQVETTAQSTICVAQLLIVGETPQFYMEGADSSA